MLAVSGIARGQGDGRPPMIVDQDQEEHETKLVGDTNCDFSFKYQTFDRNYNIPNHVEHLGRSYDQYGFTQIIQAATRETTSTSSIINDIATTNINNIHQSGVIKTCISDHYMVFCVLKFRGAHNKQQKRSISSYLAEELNILMNRNFMIP